MNCLSLPSTYRFICRNGWASHRLLVCLLTLWLGGGAGCSIVPVRFSESEETPRTMVEELARLEVDSDRLYRAIVDQADAAGYSRQLQLQSGLAGPLNPSDLEHVTNAFHRSLKVMLFDLAPSGFWERHLASYYSTTLSEAEAGRLVETYTNVDREPVSKLQEMRGSFVKDRVRDLLPEVRARSYRFKVSGQTMAPTLLPGDHIIVDQAIYRTGQPRRGDVVLFRFPDGQGLLLIYRIIGVPGDEVQVTDQRVSVNGSLLPEPYVQHTDESIQTGTVRDHLGPVTVPTDQYFVMGDNREWSLDSRFLGTIKLETILGQARFIYWSVDPGTQTPRWEHMSRPIR